MGFKHKGATISARPLTIADDNEIDLLCFRLGDDTNMYNAQKWAEYVVGSVVEGGDNPVPYVTSKSAQEDCRASYQVWEKLKRPFIQNWKSELRGAETDPKE